MGKINRWVVYNGASSEEVQKFSQELSQYDRLISWLKKRGVEDVHRFVNILAPLLLQRGMSDSNTAHEFVRPTFDDIHSPYLMRDMEKAVNRVEQGIANQEKVLIFGDYDVDGTSAVALMYSYLKEYIPKIEYYVPNRYEEGYGISMRSVEYAHDNGFSLMIVLDCGIKCHEEIATARSYGIDVIVCDHHLPDATLPEAYAILDPKREDCDYPYKELTGCGVGFKLVQALSQRKGMDVKSLYQYFDLLAISIASDVVPITGENRVLAYFGLRRINSQPRSGIEELLKYGKIVRKHASVGVPVNDCATQTVFSKEITINDLVFCVGPRINAAGRMDTGRNAVHLLISDRDDKTIQLGEKVEANNSERRALDEKTTKQAIAKIENDVNSERKRSIVVFDSNWSKGVVGIVASRLVEHFYRPTVVLTLSDDGSLYTGSARSVRNFDLYGALSQCSDVLDHFGGHTFAAGLSLKPENLTAFQQKFEKVVSETISDDAIAPIVDIDEEIQLHDVTIPLYEVLKFFAPFGPQNMLPTFMTKHVKDVGSVRVVGENHLKMSLFQENNRSYPIGAIAFGMAEYYDKISQGLPFNICYHIDMNEWQGRSYLQLIIKDIKFDFDDKDQV